MIHLTLPLRLLHAPLGLGMGPHLPLVQTYSLTRTPILGGSHMLGTVLGYLEPLQD